MQTISYEKLFVDPFDEIQEIDKILDDSYEELIKQIEKE